MIQLEDKLYTSTEVADILGVSLRSVYRYLEEDKITAEVKTATGRHRFSKKNILDFLYPDGSAQASESSPVQKIQKPREEIIAKRREAEVSEIPQPTAKVIEEVKKPTQEVKEEKLEEEPIDWLAKFREAAQKYREEAEQTTPQQSSTTQFGGGNMTMAAEPKATRESAFADDESFSTISSPIRKPKEDVRNFYRSSLGGLKDIAQNIDRGSRNSYLDYAFTLNAGLSLYKPIKPFSILHAYIKEADLSFYEKLLGLTPSDEANAQLCLILSSDEDIYKSREEMHGLFVVDKKRLLKDVQKYSDSTMAAEASSILK